MNAAVPRDSIGILVLAAGSSRRFQGDKRQALLPDGCPLLDSSLARVPDSLQRRVLVLRPGDEALAERYAAQGWDCCIAQRAALGMGHSLAEGIERARDWQGALLALGDMPFIRPTTYTLLQEELSLRPIVIPFCGEQRGNPVGFRREFFDEIARLEGDRGARELLTKYADLAWRVETKDAGVLRDIDTREALLQAGGAEG